MVLDGEHESAWWFHIWTEEYGIPFDLHHLVESNPSETPWRHWQSGSISEILGKKTQIPAEPLPPLQYIVNVQFLPFSALLSFLAVKPSLIAVFSCFSPIFLISRHNLPLIRIKYLLGSFFSPFRWPRRNFCLWLTFSCSASPAPYLSLLLNTERTETKHEKDCFWRLETEKKALERERERDQAAAWSWWEEILYKNNPGGN